LRHRTRLTPWRRRPVHEAPVVDCNCGIYATALERLAGYLDGALDGRRVHRVLGTVALWGTVIECAWGWRSSHAYPSRLYVPEKPAGRKGLPVAELALSLAEYGVPVELVRSEEHTSETPVTRSSRMPSSA